MENPYLLTEPQLARNYLAQLAPEVRHAGDRLFRSAQVYAVKCEVPGLRYSGLVDASAQNTVVLMLDAVRGWSSSCSCLKRRNCEHAAALMKAVLAEHSVAEVQALSQSFRSLSSTAHEAPLAPAGQASIGPFTDRVMQSAKAPVKNKDLQLLRGLAALYQSVLQGGTINAWSLAQLGFWGVDNRAWGHLSLWPETPKDFHTFWLYIAFYLSENRVEIPEILRPVTDLALLREAILRWRHQQELGKWKTILESSHRELAKSPVRKALDLRLKFEIPGAFIESKLIDQEHFAIVSGTQIRHICNLFEADALDLTPEAELLWNMWRQHFEAGHSDIQYTPFTLPILSRTFRSTFLASRLVTQAGLPFERPGEPLRWKAVLQAAADGREATYEVKLIHASGQPPGPILFTLPGQPCLYVAATAIFRGPPQPNSLQVHNHVVQVPAEAIETPEGIGFLDALEAELPENLAPRIRRIPFQIFVECELVILPNRYEACVVRVAARTEDSRDQEFWDGGAWHREGHLPRPASPSAPPGDIIEVRDHSRQAEISQLMEPLRLAYDAAAGGLALKVTRNFPERFSDWLKSLPPEVKVILKGELASLTLNTISARVRLETEEADIDWFDLRVALDVADTELTQEELQILLAAQGRYVRLKGKGWRRLEFNLSAEDDQLLAEMGLNPLDLNAETQRFHALQLGHSAAKKFMSESQAAQLQLRAQEIRTRVAPPLPPELTAELRPYQITGYHFLCYLAANRFGGILADDMGLGKTLQALAWLLWLRQQTQKTSLPILIVCPKSVMDNWRVETRRFANTLRVRTWEAGELCNLTSVLAEADIHVINYSQLRSASDTVTSIAWLAVILDEGQYIKNPQSQTAIVARALKAEYRLVLSGTPIENRLTDLWSLMAFAMPGVLGGRARFGRNYERKNDPLARLRLASRVRPFLLRRTKAQVARDLPDRIEEDLFCEIEGEQKTLYRAEFKRAQQILLRVKTQKELAGLQFHFLASLLRLRQICCHPALVMPETRAESAKLNALMEQLEPLMDEGQKVLVFSQFVSMLELIKPAIDKRGWRTFYLVGATENRGALVADFQSAEGAAVFLISLKAGGFGLNLTAASYVMLCDPWWNPAVENQAIDRTHRIGQANKVIAYRLLIKDSVEEKIRLLQKQKSALAQDVLGEEKFAQSLTLDDLQFLFAEEEQRAP